VDALQRHLSGIEVLLGVLRHDNEIQLIGLGRGNDLRECAGAVPAEKGVHMDHAFVFREAYGLLRGALTVELLDRGVEAA
jgi:hypothetical protein